MTHQAPPSVPTAAADPGRLVAQLREVLRLVEQYAGNPARTPSDARLEEAARVSIAYDRALPIAQRRFDAFAAESADWAAAGVEALLAAGGVASTRAAAARLAARIACALNYLAELLDQAQAPPAASHLRTGEDRATPAP